jgi:glyoxylase-like metal-dependent hydrolase (beta-lactamase superfamily II)
VADKQARCEMLTIYTEGMEAELIRPALIWDDDTAILVDLGYGGQLEQIRGEMGALGVPLERVKHILLTHRDGDHVHGLPYLKAALPGVEVMAGAPEVATINGEGPMQDWKPSTKVTRTVSDGEELPCCGGVVVVGTPGHQPGHISVYHRPTRTLVTGDALKVVDGQLFGPGPKYTVDVPLAYRSIANLARYDIQRVLCYHGGEYTGDIAGRLVEIVKESGY